MLEMLLTTRRKNGQSLPAPPAPLLTYNDWVNYVNARNFPAPLTGSSNYRALTDKDGTYCKITFDSKGSTMWGTPWGDRLTYDSNVGSSVVHCLPDVNTVTDSLNNKRVMLAKVKGIGTQPNFTGLTRNGYTSSNYTQFTGTQIIDFLYWDFTLSKVMRVNPFTKSTPVQFGG